MEQINSADRVKELSEKLQEGVREVLGSGRYADYLCTMSRFHKYSPRNAMAIFLQNPNAAQVAGFSAWKSLGRSVNKGEKGLQILAPSPYKKTVAVARDENGVALAEPQEREIICMTFKIAYVFDVSQTNGKELPRLTEQLTGEVGGFDRLMRTLREVSPYPISFERINGAANGYCDYTHQKIVIREGISQEQTAKTTIHEIAHAVMHRPDKLLDRQTVEVQAESVAYIVCQHLGIDSSQYSFGYVAGWSTGKELAVLEDSLAAIREGAAKIIDVLDAGLQRIPEQEGQKQTTLMQEANPKREGARHQEDPRKSSQQPEHPRQYSIRDRLEAAKAKCTQQSAETPPRQKDREQGVER